MSKEKLVQIMLFVKNQQTKDGRKFKHYSTKMELKVIENGVVKGIKPKYVTVKFPSNVETKTLTRGIISAKSSDISAPTVYQYDVDENGKKVFPLNDKGEQQFPTVWIRGYESFEERKKEHEFTFVIDENDTDETEIDDSDDSNEQ